MPRATPHFGWPTVSFEINRESQQARGLLAWWPTLGSRGTNVLREQGGRGHNGTFPGGAANPAWAQDSRRGSVLEFIANDYIPVVTITQNYTQLSWAAWVYTRQDIRQAFLGEQPGAADSAYIWLIESGHVSGGWAVDVFSGAAARQTIFSLVDPALNTWYHVAVTFDAATNLIMYINGQQLFSVPAVIANVRLTNVMTIGANDTDFVNGFIGDMRFASVVWTSSEVWRQFANPWDLYETPRRMWARSPFLPERGVYRGAWRGVLRGI